MGTITSVYQQKCAELGEELAREFLLGGRCDASPVSGVTTRWTATPALTHSRQSTSRFLRFLICNARLRRCRDQEIDRQSSHHDDTCSAVPRAWERGRVFALILVWFSIYWKDEHLKGEITCLVWDILSVNNL